MAALDAAVGAFVEGERAAARRADGAMAALMAAVEAEARAPQPGSEAAAVLRALRRSNLQLLESCATSTTRLSQMFEAAAAAGGEQGGGGGGAGMAARMALEAAVMEAEPPPYPMSGREQEGYAKRPCRRRTTSV